ncbi:MAG TPA: PfkB family carbohydrate kinase [Candidatus Limnocylindrales bacterium]|nr:PfkB family carbohydrate kinase [Candidatus Limnocylindrales bacterium]
MIITVGDLVTDVLAVLRAPLAPGSDTPATVHVSGGGQAANTAAWLAWLGRQVTFVGAVGDDQAGRDRLAELHAAGVHTIVSVRPGAGTGSIVVLTHGEERTMISDRGANLLLAPSDIDTAIAAGATTLHLSGYTLLDQASRPAGQAALAAAKAAGLRTSVDAASAAPLLSARDFLSWVRVADLLIANADEAQALVGNADPSVLAEATGGQAVVKLGPQGALWAGPEGVIHVALEPVPVVDATGAGDAFAAGLLAAWSTGASPREALAEGCRLGSYAVGVIGARPPRISRA